MNVGGLEPVRDALAQIAEAIGREDVPRRSAPEPARQDEVADEAPARLPRRRTGG